MEFHQVESMLHNITNTRQPMLIFFVNKFGNYQALPITIGKAEFIILSETLEDKEFPYPSQHGLALRMMELGGLEIEEARVTDVSDGYFLIQLLARTRDGEEVEIQCSPYDLYIFAAMKQIKIYVADDVLEKAGHEVPALYAEDMRWL